MSLDKLFSALKERGYRGAKGPYFMASFCMSKGKNLYEISGNKRYEIGRK